ECRQPCAPAAAGSCAAAPPAGAGSRRGRRARWRWPDCRCRCRPGVLLAWCWTLVVLDGEMVVASQLSATKQQQLLTFRAGSPTAERRRYTALATPPKSTISVGSGAALRADVLTR